MLLRVKEVLSITVLGNKYNPQLPGTDQDPRSPVHRRPYSEQVPDNPTYGCDSNSLSPGLLPDLTSHYFIDVFMCFVSVLLIP